MSFSPHEHGRGVLERIEERLAVIFDLLIDQQRHHAAGPTRSMGSIGVTLIIDRRSGPVEPITLPEHKTFSDRKTQILVAPTYLDRADTTGGPDGTVKPDPDAVITVKSSDDSQAGVERDADGKIFITTPIDGPGSATITISATSPNSRYPDTIMPFSYTAPVEGQLNVSVGSDVPDAA